MRTVQDFRKAFQAEVAFYMKNGWEKGGQARLCKKYGYSLDNLWKIERKIRKEFPELIKKDLTK